jgi:hypothetical protein
MIRMKNTLIAAIVILLFAYACSPAIAETRAPGWVLTSVVSPTHLRPGSEGQIEVIMMNLGGSPAIPGTILTDTLPSNVTPTEVGVYTGSAVPAKEGELERCTVVQVPGGTVTCEFSRLPLRVPTTMFKVAISVVAGAVEDTMDDHAEIHGGGTLRPATTAFPVAVSSSEPGFGFEHFGAWASNADGTIDTQAGSHPYELAVAFALNNYTRVAERRSMGGEIRDVNVNFPPGIVGNAQAVPQCTLTQFDTLNLLRDPDCPLDSQVGIDHVTVSGAIDYVIDIYNIVPPPGVPVQFAFNYNGIDVFLNAGVRTGGDNGITERSSDLPQRNVSANIATIWGNPAEESHDGERVGPSANGYICGNQQVEAYSTERCPAGVPTKPLLSLPTSCGSPLEYTIEVPGTWEDEHLAEPVRARTETMDSEEHPVGMTGCDRLQPFNPEISVAPDTTYADTPAGLSVDVKLPQGLNPEGYATSGLQNTTVVLPEGIAINPGQATGLAACQPSQEALGTLPNGEVNEGPASCPSASKVGTVEMATPLLAKKLEGNVYILGANPPHLQLLITASGEGVNVKLLANVHLDEKTGQLVTTVGKTPDVPFTEFKLNFSGGAQAALATPTKCGTYEANADFTPWASPFVQDQLDTSRFQITGGPSGSPCVWPMPFEPTMTAGATTDQAGGYTDFTMLLQRGDEQQRMENLSFKTPEGLLGMIAKVSLCEEPQAAQGTCSAASQIGHTVVGTGPGPYPFYIPQASAPPAPIYLTGPYKGAPFGLSIVVPLIAGPFNLGTEIVRATIQVDSHTGQVTITTDPLPQVVKGIPADLRSIDAVIDRPEFMFNPTDCSPMGFTGTATSIEGSTAPLSTHFQVGSCQALKFQPNFKVSTSGKTSRADGASLTAKIVYPVGNLGFNQASSQSNIAKVKVDLPRQLPSRLVTLQKACPAKVFEVNPANCPPASRVGHTKAITPVLPVPLEGPAYFVSHAGEEFPSLIAVLQGDNVTVDLVGSTFIDTKTNITTSTFKEVPDVPIQSFELNLPQGPYSALAANGNLCKVKGGLKMPTAFTGHNGAVLHQNTPISVTGCSKSKPKKAKATKKGKHPKGSAKKK